MAERLLDHSVTRMTFEQGRLYLRSLDLKPLANKPHPNIAEINQIVQFSRDIIRDADSELKRGRVLHPNVEAILGLLRTVVFLADEASCGWSEKFAVNATAQTGGAK